MQDSYHAGTEEQREGTLLLSTAGAGVIGMGPPRQRNPQHCKSTTQLEGWRYSDLNLLPHLHQRPDRSSHWLNAIGSPRARKPVGIQGPRHHAGLKTDVQGPTGAGGRRKSEVLFRLIPGAVRI